MGMWTDAIRINVCQCERDVYLINNNYYFESECVGFKIVMKIGLCVDCFNLFLLPSFTLLLSSSAHEACRIPYRVHDSVRLFELQVLK